MGNFEKNYGITLIALVITIIILIILAVITVNAVFGENGLLNQANKGVEEYSKSDVKERVTLLIGEYVIEKATGEEDNFANFLRKNLQVGVEQNEDGTYSFAIDEWQVITTENEVISVEKLNINADKTYATVASMKADISLADGQLVQTEGYWNKKYGGGAYYDVVSSTSLTVDDTKCIQLDNGLYAELHPINDTVTVNQFGAYGDGEHDDATAIQNALNSGYINVSFESERYKQNNNVELKNSNVNVVGNGATIFNEDDYIANNGADYHFFIIGDTNNWINNINIFNLNMESTKTSDISEIQLGAKYVQDINIENCKFLITEIEEHKNTGITNIWFHTAWKNIKINNCEILNYGKTELGGSIYLSDMEGNKCENAIISNCNIDEKSGDESIAFWGTNISGINFENNTVKDNNEDKHNSMLIRVGTIANVNIFNNYLETTSYGSLIKFGHDEDGNKVENVNVNGNIIKYNKILEGRSFNLFSISDYGGEKQANNINVSNNKINIESELEEIVDASSIISGNINFTSNEVNCNYGISAISWNSFSEISNNMISINGTIKNLFVFINSNNESDNILINNNIITITDENQWEYLEKSFLLLQELKINDRKIEINNNSVVTNQDKQQTFVAFNGIQDTIQKTIYTHNNDISIFTYIKNNNNLVEHSVKIDN